jgi:hypothetical protein
LPFHPCFSSFTIFGSSLFHFSNFFREYP